MDDEKLIECVREHPALYDPAHPKYLDCDYKAAAWERIAEALVVRDTMSCKKRWVNIRDQFKKSLNRRKSKKGQAGAILRMYKYEEILQFLLPRLQESGTLKSPSLEDQSIDAPLLIEIKSEEVTNEIHVADEENAPFSAVNENKRKKRKVENAPVIESAAAVSLKYDVFENEEQDGKHPIDAFLEGLSPIIKKLSPYRQHLARGRLFSVVQQLEAEEMFGSPNSPKCDPERSQACNTRPSPSSSTSNYNRSSRSRPPR